MQKALDKTLTQFSIKKLWYLRLCLIVNSCHKTVHKLTSCIFLFVCFCFFKPRAYTDFKNVFSLQLSWYSTIGDSHAFNFLSMKRLQNKKLHVPFVEQQKSGIMSLCLSQSQKARTRTFKRESPASAYSLIFLNACVGWMCIRYSYYSNVCCHDYNRSVLTNWLNQ